MEEMVPGDVRNFDSCSCSLLSVHTLIVKIFFRTGELQFFPAHGIFIYLFICMAFFYAQGIAFLSM